MEALHFENHIFRLVRMVVAKVLFADTSPIKTPFFIGNISLNNLGELEILNIHTKWIIRTAFSNFFL